MYIFYRTVTAIRKSCSIAMKHRYYYQYYHQIHHEHVNNRVAGRDKGI